MKFKHFYFLNFIILIISVSCKDLNTKKNHSTLNNDIESYNFDLILKCGYFSYSDSFFVTADNGCIYKLDEKNDLGNIIIYLIPKETKSIQLNEIGDYEEDVNNLNITNLKKEFRIYLYIIPKEYLIKTPEGYYQKKKYVKKLFTFNDSSKEWDFLESKNISNITEEQENIKEVSLFINKEAKKNLKSGLPYSTISDWESIYKFSLKDLEHMGEKHSIEYSFIINDNSEIISKLDNEPNLKMSCDILSITRDTLFIQDEKNNKYKIYKDYEGSYNVSGQAIYMLNPPNESYLLTREE